MFLTLIPLLISILAQLPVLIKEAEAAFGGQPGNGAMKKALVTDSVKAALDVYQAVSTHPLPVDHAQAIMGTVGSLIDSTVQAFNTASLFLKTSAPTPRAA